MDKKMSVAEARAEVTRTNECLAEAIKQQGVGGTEKEREYRDGVNVKGRGASVVGAGDGGYTYEGVVLVKNAIEI